MTQPKNFSERINGDRGKKLYVKDVPDGFFIHIDSDGWLWIEALRSKDLKKCIRIQFMWDTNLIRVHFIPVGKGTKHTNEFLMSLHPKDFATYDEFQLWICEIIRINYTLLK